MADMFLEKFRSLVPKYLEDQWNEADGLTAGELADGLAESKVQIPFVLEEFYLALGNNDDFMEAYHYFFSKTRRRSSFGVSSSPSWRSRIPLSTAGAMPRATGSARKAPSASSPWTCSPGSSRN